MEDLQDQHEKKSQKRKLEDFAAEPSGDAPRALLAQVVEQVNILNNAFYWSVRDRESAKRATYVLAELAVKEETVNLIVGGGAVPALVKHLQAPPLPRGDDRTAIPFEHEVEKGCARTLGLLSVKAEHQQLIVDCGALSHLVDQLKRHKEGSAARAVNGLIQQAADAIANIAFENSSIQNRVRMEGGIPPLVELLDFNDSKVQRAAAGALGILAFENDENKNMIVECNALPTLILMLRSEDVDVHYGAVVAIRNLVDSSPNIRKEVLSARALAPVIGLLLSSCCRESQREAALLIGQFAAADSDCKVDIVQSGAVQPLIKMLQSPDVQSRETSAFALGRLAQAEHQQLIVDCGALSHLVDQLKRHKEGSAARAVNGLIKQAADAIANLAYENSSIQNRVRMEGGIPPLVELLDFNDSKVQRAAAGALGILAFENDENKNMIVECNALPTLILMLRSGDVAVHYEAVGLIGDLVHSSSHIREKVLSAGALGPVIRLLNSCCRESQREAALLIGQFAAADSDCKVDIVQRAVVEPLIEMLQSPDVQLREMSAFALGKLAQDNMSDFIRIGGVQKLQDGEFILQATKETVAKSLKSLEEKDSCVLN